MKSAKIVLRCFATNPPCWCCGFNAVQRQNGVLTDLGTLPGINNFSDAKECLLMESRCHARAPPHH